MKEIITKVIMSMVYNEFWNLNYNWRWNFLRRVRFNCALLAHSTNISDVPATIGISVQGESYHKIGRTWPEPIWDRHHRILVIMNRIENEANISSFSEVFHNWGSESSWNIDRADYLREILFIIKYDIGIDINYNIINLCELLRDLSWNYPKVKFV